MITENIEKWIYFLRQFIYIATRYPLAGVKSNRECRVIFYNMLDVTDHRELEDAFIKDVRKVKIEIKNKKLHFVHEDLTDELIRGIDIYTQWYEHTKDEIINQDDGYFPYKYFYESMLTTKKEISKLILQNNEVNKQPPKQIDKLQWKKDSVLLAYLFNELKNKGIIEDKNVWQKLTAFFTDKDGKEFKNTDFPNYITSYTKGKTAHDGKKVPKEHAAITDILTILNEVIEKHKK